MGLWLQHTVCIKLIAILLVFRHCEVKGTWKAYWDHQFLSLETKMFKESRDSSGRVGKRLQKYNFAIYLKLIQWRWFTDTVLSYILSAFIPVPLFSNMCMTTENFDFDSKYFTFRTNLCHLFFHCPITNLCLPLSIHICLISLLFPYDTCTSSRIHRRWTLSLGILNIL